MPIYNKAYSLVNPCFSSTPTPHPSTGALWRFRVSATAISFLCASGNTFSAFSVRSSMASSGQLIDGVCSALPKSNPVEEHFGEHTDLLSMVR